jgi:putative addiction module component (TIGR02574 family)
LAGMKDPNDLLKQALRLPPEARAALAGSLLDSLDQEVDEDAETAWHAEIDRRLKEIDSGEAKLIPWSEARRKISGR